MEMASNPTIIANIVILVFSVLLIYNIIQRLILIHIELLLPDVHVKWEKEVNDFYIMLQALKNGLTFRTQREIFIGSIILVLLLTNTYHWIVYSLLVVFVLYENHRFPLQSFNHLIRGHGAIIRLVDNS